MKKMFSILLVTLMLLSPFAMCVNAESVTEQAVQVKDTNEQKITSDLQAHLDTVDDDEYVPVYVWLNDYGEDMLYEVLSQRLGKTVTADTEEAYIQDKIEVKEKLLSKGLENLAKTNEYKLQSMSQGVMDIRNLTGNEFKLQASLSGIMTDEEINTCIESNMTSTEIIELSERNQFLSDYRQARKTVNTAVNTTFYNSLDLDKCRNVYLDPALTCVSMECKKSYIDNIESMTITKSLSLQQELEAVDDAIAEEATAEEESSGSINDIMSRYEKNGYTGQGIRIGVIETGNTYNINNPHLTNRGIICVGGSTTTTSGLSHATEVLAILCGTNVNGYEGIATESTIYFTSSGTTSFAEVREKLKLLTIDYNVSIINISSRYDLTSGAAILTKYNYLDQYVDCFVSIYRVTIVAATGNDYNSVSSPARAYNVIAVGNVTNNKNSSGSYEMNTGSSYQEQSHLTNRPDIVAFGTDLYMYDSQSGSNVLTKFESGSSFSCPAVAGTVALMMQANSDLIGKPDLVKAILAQTADENFISTTNNSLVSGTPYQSTKVSCEGVIRERSGAGILNIIGATRSAVSGIFESIEFDPMYFTVGAYWTSDQYYFEAGKSIEVVMAFEKHTHDMITSSTAYPTNVDIQILDMYGSVVAKSTSTINNVEALKCTINTAGNYRFKIIYTMADMSWYELPEGMSSSEHIVHEFGRASFTFACCNSPSLTQVSGTTYCNNCGENLCS